MNDGSVASGCKASLGDGLRIGQADRVKDTVGPEYGLRDVSSQHGAKRRAGRGGSVKRQLHRDAID
eukprot:772173-Prymnesium_polylepis.2